jgi:ATP-binding cassette subfamily B protein
MELFRALFPFARRYWQRTLGGLLCAIVSAALTASIPQVLRIAIDDLNQRGVVANDLLRFGLIMVGLALIDSLFRFGLRILVNGTSYLIEFDIRETLFAKLIALDQHFFNRMHTGDLMARVTNDLSAIRQFLGPGVSSLMSTGLILLAVGSLLMLTNVTLALIMLLMLPIVTVVFIVIGTRMKRVFRSVQDQFGHISTRAQENFSGIRTIKAYAQEEAEIRVFREENEKYRALNIRYVLLSGMLWPAITLGLGTITALVLFVGGQFVAAGTLTLGELVLFNTYLALLAWPMIALGWTVSLYQQASASMLRIGEVLRRQPSITTPTIASPIQAQGAIEFRAVGIRLEHTDLLDHPHNATSERWLVRQISFQVPAGGSLGIVGATGVGKTTLVNLLARVRDPDEGQVLLDGRDLREWDLNDLRQAVGYVPQNTFLFSVPLRENVTFGHPDATNDEIERAISISRLSNDLVQFPDGLDTLIGERGVTLSGGQKQRTAIARAVLHDPAVLVLDDALSSVDTHTAAEILQGMREVLRGRTSIIIAQRIATVKDANQIVVLHEGAIVEQGTHQQLLTRNGRYAAMYRRELLAQELEDA